MISQLAMVFTFLQFLSGSLICYKFVKQGHTGSLSALTFICGVFSTGWVISLYHKLNVNLIYTGINYIRTRLNYILIFYIYIYFYNLLIY